MMLEKAERPKGDGSGADDLGQLVGSQFLVPPDATLSATG
jgi:hypothetical protein